jgi:isoquinoline 1-oxidoreductase beta subunit
MNQIVVLRRRDFLKSAVGFGGGLLLGFRLQVMGSEAPRDPVAFLPNAYLRIAPDESITIIVARTELGQGVYTSLPMLIAEELEIDLDRVRIEPASVDATYTNPIFGMQMTGGSTSIVSSWEPLRSAGAAAREMLIAAAAQVWGVPPASCRAENGFIKHSDRTEKLSYGQLAERASRLAVPESPALKQPKDYKLIGTSRKRLDTPEKVSGAATFGIDVRVPGMLTAVVSRPPVLGGKVRSYTAERAKQMPGIQAIVPLDSGIAVVADGFWPAHQACRSLEIVWDEGPLRDFSTTAQRERYAELIKQPGGVARKDGDTMAAIGAAATKIEASYELPYLAHATMEPISCVANCQAESCEIWIGTQFQTLDRDAAAQASGLRPEQVKLHTTLVGGSFGRKAAPDGHIVREAVAVSKAVRAPVKVIWTREDDIRGGYYRPFYRDFLAAGLDVSRQPVGWLHRVVGQSMLLDTPFERYVQADREADSLEGARDLPYEIPNILVEVHTPRTGPRVWAWRSVGSSHNGFVVESFLDEVAHAAGKDPFEFRRAMLKAHPRHRAVLELAAEKAGWGKNLPAGHGLGIALHQFGSIVAQVAEVSLTGAGAVKVHRVVCAIDCGLVVHPDTVRAQMEGGIAFGLSAALYGEITFENGRVQQSNFNDYPVLRMDAMPAVDVHIVPSAEIPTGLGEAGVPPIAAAVANATFAITGKRIRQLPIQREVLRAA